MMEAGPVSSAAEPGDGMSEVPRSDSPDRPRLEACWFRNPDAHRNQMYRRLAQVLDYSARKHCPGWIVNLERLEPPPYVSAMGNPSHVWNTQKLEFWRRQTLAAPDGARLLLIDGDMLFRKPIDSIWDHDFEMAYTIRDGGSRLPFNGGVVFIRVSTATRAFLDRWWAVNLRFLTHAAEHKNWRLKYAGINQASFGCLLEKGTGLTKILKLKCSEWNLCEWERHPPEGARIIHIKSSLRVRLFHELQRSGAGRHSKQIIAWWLAEEKEMEHWQKRQTAKSASSGTEPTASTSAGA